jgi:hypothetical protein
LEYPKQNVEGCKSDDKFNIELHNHIKNSESPKHLFVSAVPNIPGLIWPTWRHMTQSEMLWITVTALETGRNNGKKKKYNTIGQFVLTRFGLLVDWEFHLEKYYQRILSSHMWLIVHQ